MARIQSEDYGSKREAIVECAAKLFANKGFATTSVAQLAASCRMSKSLLYHYFPSKEDILFEVMNSHISQLREEIERISKSSTNPFKTLSEIIHSFTRQYSGASSRQKVVLSELGRLPANQRAVVIESQRAIVAALERIICQVQPELKKNSPKARAKTMIVFGMINWLHTWFDPLGALSPDDLADMVVETIVGKKNASNGDRIPATQFGQLATPRLRAR